MQYLLFCCRACSFCSSCFLCDIICLIRCWYQPLYHNRGEMKCFLYVHFSSHILRCIFHLTSIGHHSLGKAGNITKKTNRLEIVLLMSSKSNPTYHFKNCIDIPFILTLPNKSSLSTISRLINSTWQQPLRRNWMSRIYANSPCKRAYNKCH